MSGASMFEGIRAFYDWIAKPLFVTACLLCHAQMSQQYYQRDPQHWEDPDEFRPERLLPLGATASPAWTPFGEVTISLVFLNIRRAAYEWQTFTNLIDVSSSPTS